MRRCPPAALLAIGLALAPGAAVRADAIPADPIPPGAGQQTAEIGGVALQVFTYRPDGCTPAGILLVFHGLGRTAAGYRDHAVPLARRLCMVVVAPLFDAQRFPAWRYQRGGVVHDGQPQPADTWTVGMVPRLVDWARAAAGAAELPYALLGHSAGGQFLSRVAAYEPLQAAHIVIANPSTWVLPSLTEPAPYGFGGLYPPAEAEAALQRYLGAPITVLLGGADTGSKELATSAAADEQGANRLERGQNAFRDAQAAARAHGWAFNWRLMIVPGVGHDATRMFASDQAAEALRP